MAACGGVKPTLTQRLGARRPGDRKPVMFQSWRNLLFLHWKLPPAVVQERLPPGLFVDEFDGSAYVGVVPFFMCGVRPRCLPPVPGLSNFLELNVRTYVHDDQGVPGVWFFSLDANCAPAVWVARTFFNLPYRHAKMSARRSDDGWVDYRSRCRSGNYDGQFRYRGHGEVGEAEPGSLEFFLLERYFLYAHDAKANRLFRGQVAHAPYRFGGAVVEEFDRGVMSGQGIDPGVRDFDHACVASDVAVRIFALEKLP